MAGALLPASWGGGQKGRPGSAWHCSQSLKSGVQRAGPGCEDLPAMGATRERNQHHQAFF